jgi:hypothetical protein
VKGEKMEVGDYIKKRSLWDSTIGIGKIVKEDGEIFIVEWPSGAKQAIRKDSTEYEVIGKGTSGTGWGKGKKTMV